MPGSALEKLRRSANLKSTKRVVVLNDGSEFEFWTKPLTMAERERAQRDAKSEDINQVAIQMLIQKATDANGGRLFGPGDISVLKNEIRDDDLQKLMIAIISDESEEEEAPDMKSTGKGSKG